MVADRESQTSTGVEQFHYAGCALFDRLLRGASYTLQWPWESMLVLSAVELFPFVKS